MLEKFPFTFLFLFCNNERTSVPVLRLLLPHCLPRFISLVLYFHQRLLSLRYQKVRHEEKKWNNNSFNFFMFPFRRKSFMTRIFVTEWRKVSLFFYSFCKHLASINASLLIYLSIKTNSDSLLTSLIQQKFSTFLLLD